ncbi:head scaffolding protein [PinkBerry-associated phage LS06-2018-MD08]|nr:head scaffolding protein [PinkBerry-associated phage LS06-2018-MD08]
MEDNNTTVDTQTTTTSVESTSEVKTFTQEQLDQAVTNRLARTKETIAKKLGLESYSDEALESFVSDYKDKSTKVTELSETIATKDNILFDKDLTIGALNSGVTQDNIAKVAKLVKSDMQDNNELDVQTALTQVLTDYPFFAQSSAENKPAEVKVGVEVTGKAPLKNEVDDYLNSGRYKNSRYTKK